MPQPHPQDAAYTASLSSPEEFWSHHATALSWHKRPSRVLDRSTKRLESGVSHPDWAWFPDGEISTCYNLVDRHVDAGNGNATAIIWDSPVTKRKARWTYGELKEEVEVLAGVLREEGLRRGDVCVVYMPMIPQALLSILAITRLGATHAVVFGGFSSAALAQRIDSARPRLILTASCGIEGNKGPASYAPLIRGAVKKSKFKPEKVLVWQREELRWDKLLERNGERDWGSLVELARRKGVKADCVPVGAGEPVYVIYTSGTTGTPKGVVRPAAGHLVGLSLSIRQVFGIRGPGDVMFCASDIGWVVGHSYILYAPLLAGAATVLYEGKPVGTPDASSFWRVLKEHEVTAMFTAPTALRAIRREDPENRCFDGAARDGGLKRLKALFLAGERSEPSICQAYQSLLERHCAPGAQVIDNWWSSESGSPITALAIAPSEGLSFDSSHPASATPTEMLKMKPGAAGKPTPGFDVRAVDDSGKEVARGDMGNIVMALPLAPTAFTTLWRDPERFYASYLKRFDGRWLDTGDAGMIDEDGYVSIMSRADDVLNVAGHRLATGAIEQAITAHSSVAEAAVVPIFDELKGHLPFAFATLALDPHPRAPVPDEKLYGEVQQLIRDQIGGIACLGGMCVGQGMIPKTRSGKTLRRVLRGLVENAVGGDFEKKVDVPATVEDAGVVDVARERIRAYFEAQGKGSGSSAGGTTSKL